MGAERLGSGGGTTLSGPLGTLGEMGPREGQEDGGLISDTSVLWWDVNSLLGAAAKTLNHYRGSVSAGERQGRWGRCGHSPNSTHYGHPGQEYWVNMSPQSHVHLETMSVSPYGKRVSAGVTKLK